jgi:prolyl 4-hydroxylase
MKGFIALLAVAAFLTFIVILLWEEKGRGYLQNEDHWRPPEVHYGVLTQDECSYIIRQAEKSFKRSGVVGQDTPSDARTSETAWIPKDDPVARKVLDKACKLSGKPYENAENLQVVRYKPGTYYKHHHDSCCDDSQACSKFEEVGGQRVATLLVYLNDDFTKGETHFPQWGDSKMKPPSGAGILFRPLGSEEAKCHPHALHAGLPIGEGTKYVCNAWIRENKFTVFGV